MVTFLQVSADMAVAVDVPEGHGHVYVADVANAWAAVLQPPGWTPEKTEKLRPLLRTDDTPQSQRRPAPPTAASSASTGPRPAPQQPAAASAW